MNDSTPSLSPGNREVLRARLHAEPDILAAYLHGSMTKGTARPDSDVDVALQLVRGAGLNARARLDLAADLAALLHRPVDLGLLSSQNLVYATQVAAHGERLFSRAPMESDRFLAQSLAQYAELQRARRAVLHAYAA